MRRRRRIMKRKRRKKRVWGVGVGFAHSSGMIESTLSKK